MLRNLEKTYGPVIRENVLNDRGQVAQNVQVLHNDTLWIERDDMKFALRSGDKVIFMLMVAGGMTAHVVLLPQDGNRGWTG